MDIKEILSLPFHKITEKENLKVLVQQYKEELDRTVCVSCRGSLNEMILTLKKYNNMSNFELKHNKYYRLEKGTGKTINNNIITDELAIEFLRIDPTRIRVFEKYPEDWKQLVGIEPIDEDEIREELSNFKLTELREQYPNIKQVSKDDFISDILASKKQ